jgi:hypothetical protein
MTEDEYEAHLDSVIAAIATAELVTAAQIAAKMLPDHLKNIKVFQALKSLRSGVTPVQLEKAHTKKAAQDLHDNKIKDLLGVCPTTEREMIAAFIAQGQYTANYACEFVDPNGKLAKREDLLRTLIPFTQVHLYVVSSTPSR